MPLAHPVSQPFHLPVSPLVAALLAGGLVLLVAFACPRGRPRSLREAERHVASWAGSLSAAQMVTRALAAAFLALAIVAGRIGIDDELENLAPALLIGAAWPFLALASITFGPVWRWIDPWDGLARALTAGRPDGPPGGVWPAVPVAAVGVWYLSAYADVLDPRAVGAAAALYTLVTVAGCLAVGRVRWLGASEPLGIVLSWMALLPGRRLPDWEPPRGAEALLGVLAGGVLFGAVRRSEIWGDLNTDPDARFFAVLGVAGFSLAGAGLLVSVAALAGRLGARAAVVRAAVPALAGIIVAVAMDRNRLFTSIQLLPGLFGDPFGRGVDLFGQASVGLDPAPLGVRGLLAAQLAVLLVGFLVGAVVLARRTGRRDRTPAAAALAVLAGASIIAVASH